MKILKIIFIVYLLKLLYDFFNWLYGYFLRIKWISYFNKNNKNAIQYTYQIRKYLSNVPTNNYVSEIFAKYNQDKIYNLFLEAHGYYRYLFRQNFNPFYWIKLIIFLPQNILYYLGFNFKRKFLNIINFIWWLCSIVFAIYNDEITSYIKELIKLFFEKFTN